MRAEGCPEEAEVSLLLCADGRIRTLNRVWRGKDAATDVLSFSQVEGSGKKVSLKGVRREGRGPILLGDIVISVQTAAKQAKSARISLPEELNFLLVHGILHLLGWEDSSPRSRKRMLARQKELLSRREKGFAGQ